MPSVEQVRKNERRKQKERKSPYKVEDEPDLSELKVFDCDASGAFYSPMNKIPIDLQRTVIDLLRRGKSLFDVNRLTGLHISTLKTLQSRDAISPSRCNAYRCGQCGCKSVAKPCFICESRRMAGVHYEG